MTNNQNELTPRDAQRALTDVNTMKRAGWRLSVPPRWVNAGHAFFSAGVCATFALEPLKNIYFYWWIIAYIIFTGAIVKSLASIAREFPPPPGRRLAFWGTRIGLLILVVGSAELRWAYDAPWISIAAGIVSGIWLYLHCENERRHCLALSTIDETH